MAQFRCFLSKKAAVPLNTMKKRYLAAMILGIGLMVCLSVILVLKTKKEQETVEPLFPAESITTVPDSIDESVPVRPSVTPSPAEGIPDSSTSVESHNAVPTPVTQTEPNDPESNQSESTNEGIIAQSVSDEDYVYDEDKFDLPKGMDLRGMIRILGEDKIDPIYTEHLNQIADEFSACLYYEYEGYNALPKSIKMIPYKDRALLDVDMNFEKAYFEVRYHDEGGFYYFPKAYVDDEEVLYYEESLYGDEGTEYPDANKPNT